MIANKTLAENHNLISEAKFQLKIALLITRRNFQDLFSGPPKFKKAQQFKNGQITSVSESDLWNADDNEQNWVLTAGKIQNLRLATKRINGLEIPANQIFSFWKHIGNPNFGKGFVVGREIREGCIVPSIAGGLCQLSNALYDAALLAGFEIIERHRHTKVIKGSLAERDRDATIKWNYVDLRFKSPHPFRIEIELTPEKLIAKFKSTENTTVGIAPKLNSLLQSSKLNDCYSCGNFDCFKHPDRSAITDQKAKTTFILDYKWPEYDVYIKSIAAENDVFIIPIKKNKSIKTDKYNWSIKNIANIKSVPFAALKRAFLMRLLSKSKNNVFSLMLRLDKRVAKASAQKIPVESTRLVISQNLLPFLWEQGVLGGRTFDVLMTRLPMEKLHERLDLAHANYPESKTLNDFRAPQTLIDLENAALTKSRNIITPHQEIADIFNNKSVKLDWVVPKVQGINNITTNKILFPASALGRKGAYEMKRLAIELNLSVIIAGKATEDENFWDGADARIAEGNPFDDISMVIYPAYVEHQPRILLKAIALGIPVITTTAVGLEPSDKVSIVPVGNYEALKDALNQLLKKMARSKNLISNR